MDTRHVYSPASQFSLALFLQSAQPWNGCWGVPAQCQSSTHSQETRSLPADPSTFIQWPLLTAPSLKPNDTTSFGAISCCPQTCLCKHVSFYTTGKLRHKGSSLSAPFKQKLYCSLLVGDAPSREGACPGQSRRVLRHTHHVLPSGDQGSLPLKHSLSYYLGG